MVVVHAPGDRGGGMAKAVAHLLALREPLLQLIQASLAEVS
jgi:hypothetical protein